MKIRCKVTCNSRFPFKDDGYYLAFTPVTTGSEENKSFFKYTPGGQFQLNLTQAETAEKFVVGNEYYVDFTPTVIEGVAE